MRRCGYDVILRSSSDNFLDNMLPPLRIGIGHDTHRLGPGRPFIVGGLVIPFDKGPIGHSDGDVLLHALTDALLGALALGDIGDWFPNTDPRWAGADSMQFVVEALRVVTEKGWSVVNVDAIIHAERPKLGPHKREIASRVAEILGIPADRVSVKAKSGEGVGPVGLGEALQAEVVVLLAAGGA
jgi:2-C-methyl-D-erythritol 2,4-cyclodiphosphate synthase